MTKPRYDVPEASGGSRTGNLLAGLGKHAIDMFTGKRELMLNRAKKIDSKTIDVGFRAIDAELDKQRLIEFAPLMKTTGVTEITPYSIKTAKEGNKPGDKPNTKGKKGNTKSSTASNTPNQGQPTTEDSGPESSTSKMKPTGAKKPAAKRASKKSAAPSLPSKASGQPAPAQAEAEAWPGAGPRFDGSGKNVIKKRAAKKAPASKPVSTTKKNGNASGTNGNKKGGM